MTWTHLVAVVGGDDKWKDYAFEGRAERFYQWGVRERVKSDQIPSS